MLYTHEEWDEYYRQNPGEAPPHYWSDSEDEGQSAGYGGAGHGGASYGGGGGERMSSAPRRASRKFKAAANTVRAAYRFAKGEGSYEQGGYGEQKEGGLRSGGSGGDDYDNDNLAGYQDGHEVRVGGSLRAR